MIDVGSTSKREDEGSSHRRRCYDIFLTFRGEGTRMGFINPLFGALDQVGVKTSVGVEESPPGKEFLDTKIEAIRSCRIAVVVFSKNYANSPLCLYEVTEIVERMKEEGLIVLPIFYDVDPSDVGNQTGPYSEAFAQHELHCKYQVERWRVALKEASSFSGYMVHPDKAELVLKNIVRHALSALNYTWFQSPANPVGMESHLIEFRSFLIQDVQMVAICGIEGIGKTTIAKTLYKNYGAFFNHHAILENVRETCRESSHKGLLKLQRRLLSQVRKEEERIRDVDEGADVIKRNCRDLRLLLVIDDVNDAVQLEKLAGACDWFGPRSVIIVTTRDRSVLHGREEMKLYEVLPLNAADAHQLFTRIAFQDNDNVDAYEGIVNAAVELAQGLPLAISALGDLFRSIPKNEWQITLEVLKRCPPDSCSNLDELLSSSHGLQSSVFHQCSKLVELPLMPPSTHGLVVKSFRNLVDLRYLPPSLQSLDISECSELVELPLLPPGLQSLTVRWCSNLAKLPLFPPSLQSLVVEGCRNLVDFPCLPTNLQNLDVRSCINLAELPPLLPSLKCLDVDICITLAKLPPLPFSLQSLVVGYCSKLANLPRLPPSLQYLNVKDCSELAELPPLPQGLQSLVVLNCMNLAKLPSLPPRIQNLDVEDCIELAELPPFPHSLQILVVFKCMKLTKLPWLPPSLQNLDVKDCSELAELPPLPPSLQILVVHCVSLAKLPSLPPRLQSLDVKCFELVELPPLPLSLQSLLVSFCSKLAKLPQLPRNLKNLHVTRCSELAELPPLPHSLESLYVSMCNKLAKLPLLPPILQRLKVFQCFKLVELPQLPPSCQNLVVHWCYELAELPTLSPCLERLKVSRCSELAMLPLLPPSLWSLHVVECFELVELPPLPLGLQSLVVKDCCRLEKLPQLPPNLQYLLVTGCSKLAELPPLPPTLENLDVSGCSELAELLTLPPSLQRLDVSLCRQLAKLPRLPPRLQIVGGCINFAELTPWPPTLKFSDVNEFKVSVGPTFLPSFEILDVNENHEFCEIPLLPPSLQRSAVDDCSSLVELQSSTPRLETAEPPLPIDFQSLFWSSCLSMSKCLESLVRMEILNELSLNKTAIDELPPSIENLVGLKKLFLQKCKNIKTLPDSIYRLRSLERVSLDGCSKLVKFPKYADGSSSSASVQKPLLFPKWTYMDLRGCCLSEINFINDLDCVSTVKNFDLSGNKLVTVPECISKLTALQQLNLENCKQLREILGLPPNLKYLIVKGCKSLEWYVPLSRMLKSNSINTPRFRQIDFSGCDKLSHGDSSLANFFSIEDLIVDSQIKILHPGSQVPKWFRYKSMEGSISFSVDLELYQNIAGLAFCMVMGLEVRGHNEVAFSCQIEVFINNLRTYGYMDFFKSVGSDNMWLMYVPSPMICGWDTHMQNQCNEFMVLFESSKETLKICGVHLLLKKDWEAIQKTDTSDGEKPKKRIRLI